MAYRHVSVMPKETLALLNCRPGGIYVDGTLGGAGHARGICRAIEEKGTLIGIDQDPDAIFHARATLADCPGRVELFQENFANLPDILTRLQISAIDGVVLDLGLSMHQIEGSGRGFSFNRDEPLDMRMNPDARTTAADLVNQLSEKELADLFFHFGEERSSRKIARAIALKRRSTPIATSAQLSTVVTQAMGPKGQRQHIHPATRVFMALRIAVNRELEQLQTFLDEAAGWLKTGGRMVILSFHSLEDRLVKHRFKRLAQACSCPPRLPQCVCQGQAVMRVLTPKALRPGTAEIQANPAARSTRLRGAEKLPPANVSKVMDT